jgi:hypothetical protein
MSPENQTLSEKIGWYKKQKYVTQETSVRNTNKQVKSSTANEKIEEVNRKPMDSSTAAFTDHQEVKKNSWRGYVNQA